MGVISLVPPQAAGRTEAVRSVRRAKNKERTRRSLFFGGPAQNRTAVLQGSSADPTRLVGDRSRARKVHRRPFRTHASEDRSAAGEVSRRKEFPTGLTPRFRPWADERRRSLKSQAASATRRVARAATDLLLFLSAFKKFPFLRSRASGVHPANSACNRIQYRPESDPLLYFIPAEGKSQTF